MAMCLTNELKTIADEGHRRSTLGQILGTGLILARSRPLGRIRPYQGHMARTMPGLGNMARTRPDLVHLAELERYWKFGQRQN